MSDNAGLTEVWYCLQVWAWTGALPVDGTWTRGQSLPGPPAVYDWTRSQSLPGPPAVYDWVCLQLSRPALMAPCPAVDVALTACDDRAIDRLCPAEECPRGWGRVGVQYCSERSALHQPGGVKRRRRERAVDDWPFNRTVWRTRWYTNIHAN